LVLIPISLLITLFFQILWARSSVVLRWNSNGLPEAQQNAPFATVRSRVQSDVTSSERRSDFADLLSRE